MKPQLANDADLATLPYASGVMGMPKIDGVRAWNPAGTFLGRSMDPFKGFGVTEYFSRGDFQGLDGEVTLGPDPTGERLCHVTTGALGKFKGVTKMDDFHWWLFDYVPEIEDLARPYEERYEMLEKRFRALNHERLHLVPFEIVKDMQHANSMIGEHLDLKYEGSIFRNAKAGGKQGRPGKKTQELVRVKPWVDSEILVTGVTEGETNTNEAKINSLGRTERSSSKEGMVPNGMVGSIQGTVYGGDICDFAGRVLFKEGQPVTIGTGVMTEAEAKAWFEDQTQIVGWIVKFKHLAYGVKDQPRMGTYLSRRLPQDMS